MKIFLDTAHIPSIKKYITTGLIDGVTTNPTHLSKESGNVTQHVLDICALLPEGQISVEVTEHDSKAVYKQAKQIAALAPNILVKVPCHAMYYPVITQLVKEDIPINVTLVFTLTQALMMAKMGVAMISPFIGRLDDSGAHGIDLIYQIRHMLDTYAFNAELLAASIRSEAHFCDAILAGADSITVPVDVFEKSITHFLTDQGMERFDADWKKLGIRQFP